ncbi:MAG: hypothetical protein LBL82_02950 [Oscillospiraceae bacterium]|jgi:hypothetical protein|nr:hypothetical protein [Oscillospiraceae bacterium]
MKKFSFIAAIVVLFSLFGCADKEIKSSNASLDDDSFFTEVEGDFSSRIDIDFYYTGDPGYPNKSLPGRAILGSAGCCFRAKNAVVYMLDENGGITPLFTEKLIDNHDTYECNNIPEIDAPIQIIIDFTEQYADTKRVSFKVAEFSSTDEMIREGLLLCFGDGDLAVFVGESKSLFKAGTHRGDKEGSWYKEERLELIPSPASA